MLMNGEHRSLKVWLRICVERQLAKQSISTSSENGSGMRYCQKLYMGLMHQGSKIGDLIVRSLRVCQKYVRSQYGKDPMILARAILEANEIVLVPVYSDQSNNSTPSPQPTIFALSIKSFIQSTPQALVSKFRVRWLHGLPRPTSLPTWHLNTMQHYLYYAISMPASRQKSISKPDIHANKPKPWKERMYD